MKHAILLTLLTHAGLLLGADDPGSPKAALHLNVDLSDGSHIVGTPSITSLSVRTSFGTLDLPLSRIYSFQSEQADTAAMVELANGDRLTGQINLRSLDLGTCFGKIGIPGQHIRRVAVVDFDVAAGKALALWNRLGSDFEILRSVVGPEGKAWGRPNYSAGRHGRGVSCGEGTGIQFDPEKLPGFDVPATYEMWIRAPVPSARQRMVLWTHQSREFVGINLHMDPGGRLMLGCCNADGHGVMGSAPVSGRLEPGRWYHLALVWDFAEGIEGGDTLRFYLNGYVTHRSAKKFERLHKMGAVGSHLNLMLGAYGYGGNVFENFDGIIDEFKVWNCARVSFSRVSGAN